MHKSSCVATENWERWKSGKTVHYDTLQDPLFMSPELTQDLRKRLGAHTSINDASSEVPLGKEMVEETYSEKKADRCKRRHQSDGVWTTVV